MNRHHASYIVLDPRAHQAKNLVPIVIPKDQASVSVQYQNISYKGKSFFLYDVGESNLLPLNQVYEAAVLNHPAFPKSETLGFVVRAEKILQEQISHLITLRMASLKAVLSQLDSPIEIQAQTGKYQNYDFYRQAKWQFNHSMKANGDNDVFAVFDREMNQSAHQNNPDHVSSEVLATIQVSYPTLKQFPQAHLESYSTELSQLERLPTIYTWKKGISAESLNRLKEIAGTEDVAEIGRYLNRNDVPLPVIARMLLQAFSKAEKRNVKTIFIFGTSRNINVFTRFYGFEKIDGFDYNVEISSMGLPAETGSGAFHKIGSENYLKMIEKLKTLSAD